jgi:hypothetical protein
LPDVPYRPFPAAATDGDKEAAVAYEQLRSAEE